MRFWTSDLHFGHANIITYCNRPYDSVEQMNNSIITTWNTHVSPADEVIIVGDFAMGKIADTLPLVDYLNGKLTLICGNHDRPWDGHKKTGQWKQKYLDAGFHEVLTGYDGLDGYEPGVHSFILRNESTMIPVFVSHFPHAGESDPDRDDRYFDWRPADDGNWLIHGHVHDMWRVNGRQINVGWDAWGKPLTDDQILATINEFEGKNKLWTPDGRTSDVRR